METSLAIKTKPKKFYSPPVLIVYGKVADLTAGGTGKDKEGMNNETNKHP